MRVCLMVEGQEDVTWEQWLELARAAEETGFDALFRSDHYLTFDRGRQRGSLDAWTTLAGIGAITHRLKLGTLVSPVTFRHPSLLAKAVATVDHISGGRAELGIGAGWFDAEHRAYGFEFPDDGTRMEMLEEQIEIVNRQWTENNLTFEGRHYRVDGLDAQPKPVQSPRPNVIVGGGAGKRSVALAARWADEYNVVYATPASCRETREAVERGWTEGGRDPSELVFSLMTGCVVGSDESDLERRTRALMERAGESGSPEAWIDGHREEWIAGTSTEAVDKLKELEDAGVQRVMLQMQDHRDVEMVRLIGSEIVPQV